VHDRLGLFSDEDSHACRVINIGLSLTYRQEELEALSAGNALRLEQHRLASAPAGALDASAGDPVGGQGGDIGVPLGGTSFHHNSLTAAGPSGGTTPGKRDRDDGQRVAGGAGGDNDVPLGGPVITRGASRGELVLNDGGLVVQRRAPPGVDGLATPVASDTPAQIAAQPLVTVTDLQPQLEPLIDAIRCAKEVLSTVFTRTDAKEVLRGLLRRALVCWGHLNSELVASMGTVAKKDKTVDGRVAVRALLSRFWPTWQVPDGAPSRIPPVGSVASSFYGGRATQSGEWAMSVNLEHVNPVISKMVVKSQSYFNKNGLPAVVEVGRMSANYKPPLPTTVASMLVVCTWDAGFCSILKQLAHARPAPTDGTAPLVVAACHNFKTAGLGEAETLLSGDELEDKDTSDDDGSSSDGLGTDASQGDETDDAGAPTTSRGSSPCRGRHTPSSAARDERQRSSLIKN